MKSQIMVGMIRCFIAEQEIVMFLSGNYNWPDKDKGTIKYFV